MSVPIVSTTNPPSWSHENGCHRNARENAHTSPGRRAFNTTRCDALRCFVTVMLRRDRQLNSVTHKQAQQDHAQHCLAYMKVMNVDTRRISAATASAKRQLLEIMRLASMKSAALPVGCDATGM